MNLITKWTKLFGTSGNDDAFGLAIGADNSVYLVGTQGGSSPPLDRTVDGYVAKFSNRGDLLWRSIIGSAEHYEAVYDVAISAGDLWIAWKSSQLGSVFGRYSGTTGLPIGMAFSGPGYLYASSPLELMGGVKR